MKNLLLLLTVFLVFLFCPNPIVCGQGIGINSSGNPADASAILDASSNIKGVLISRMTSVERDAIVSPAEGLLIFNTTTQCFNVYKNLGWYEWCGTCIPPAAPVAGNNGPVCEGSALSLNASIITNAAYNWTGPNSFSSTNQNPIVSTGATIAMTGTYTVVASLPNGCSSSPATTTVVVNSVPAAPSASTHAASIDQIVWNWNNVSGATGYKWNTSNNYSSATDNGASTSYAQSSLACGTLYTLYVWAYNSCGNSTEATLTQATSGCPCQDASGGTIIHVNGKTIHTFPSSGTFLAPSCLTNVEVLVVAGGGGGSGGFSGAGGAGGLIHNSSYAVTTSPITVIVGNGGSGAPPGEGTNGTKGENSVFGSLVAIGGGHGVGYSGLVAGCNGGSGGGGHYGGGTSAGAGTPGQGYDGGGFGNSGLYYPTGGGGGSASTGDAGVSGVRGGNGGTGTLLSISGTPTYYASGGGGSTYGAGGTAGMASAGGGGNGCHAATSSSCTGVSGTPNTGGGGGSGGGYSGAGGNGGSGIVIVSYATSPGCLPEPTAGTSTSTANQITWNWNTVSGASGYKWNTVNNYSNATDNGTSITYTQTGLSCGTSYTLYVWSYNNCGPSNAISITQTTTACPCSEATGGTITHANGKTIHTFTTSGSFTPPACISNVEVLVVAGGGGGGSYYSAGGGGGGGVVYNSSFVVSPQTYIVTVGNGGAGGGSQLQGSNGGSSIFSSITAIGGGGGGGYNNPSGLSGGSGGGAGKPDDKAPGTPGSGTPSQGNAGGLSSASFGTSGGGGGAGAAGSNASGSTSGNGGAGLTFNISGSPVTYGGGGGAGAGNGNSPGTGGTGGGGNGSSGHTSSVIVGSNGTANTGGGGGGQGQGITGYSGGSGIVIISYPTP